MSLCRGMNVSMQRQQMRHLEEIGRSRGLRDQETGLLAELIRLDQERARKRRSCLVDQHERAKLRVSQLDSELARLKVSCGN
jgi:hypothetical protein